MADDSVREAVGVFHDAENLQSAADELLVSGFDRSALSLLAGHRTIELKLGHMYDKVTALEDDPEVPRLAYIGSDSRVEAEALAVGGLAYVGAIAAVGAVVASGGTIAAALIGAAAMGGAGGLIGSVLAKLIGQHHADYLREQLDRGGLLLWVHVEDAEHERRARDILERYSADDVHLHDLPIVKHPVEGGLSYDLSFMKRLGM